MFKKLVKHQFDFKEENKQKNNLNHEKLNHKTLEITKDWLHSFT